MEHRSRSRATLPLALARVASVLLLASACAPAPPPTAAAPTTAPTVAAPAVAAAPTLAAAQATSSPVAVAAGAQKNLQEVRVGMAFIPNVQFAPFYVADAKGYFAQEGIKPVYDYGFEQDVVALTAQDQLVFTNSGASSTIIARSHDVPVRYFVKEYASMPIAIFALKDKGIAKLADLKGKSIGQPSPFGDTYVGFKIMLDKGGLKESDVNQVSIGFTQVESLLNNKVDAAVGYSVNEPFQLKAQGKEVTEFDLRDVAPEVTGNGLIASEKTLAEKPELARGFARAFLHGLDDTVRNPQEAFNITLTYVPDIAKDEKVKQAQLQTLQLVANDYWKTSGKLGASDASLWGGTQKLMKDTGLIDKETDMSRAITNDYLP